MVKQFGLPSYIIWTFAGVAFTVAGIIFIFEWTAGLATLILATGVGFTGYWFFFRPAFVALSVMKSGEPAMAIILKVWDTGVTVDHNPRLGLLLEIRHRSMVPYEIELRQNVKPTEIKNYQVGRTLQVKVDTKNPRKVAILAA